METSTRLGAGEPRLLTHEYRVHGTQGLAMKNVTILRITRKSAENQKISQGPFVETIAEICLGDCREQQEASQHRRYLQKRERSRPHTAQTEAGRQKRLDEQKPRGSWAPRGKAALICSLGQLHSGPRVGFLFLYLLPPPSVCSLV